MAVKINGSTGITFEDNDKENWGTGNDLEIYHDGSNSNINNATGSLRIQVDEFRVKSQDNNENIIRGSKDGAVELYHDNVKKFQTYASGAQVNSTNLQFTEAGTAYIDKLSNGSGLVFRASTSSDADTQVCTMHGGPGGVGALDLPDNTRLRAGTGNDLAIYHSGTDTFIVNDTGEFKIRGDILRLQSAGGEDYLYGAANGVVNLYYDGNKKFETTTDGVSISGDLRISTDNDYIGLGTDNDLQIRHTGSYAGVNNSTGYFVNDIAGDWYVRNQDGSENRIRANNDGAVELYHNGTKTCETSADGLAFPSGKGINFNATADASGTVTLQGSYDDLEYTKVGRLVHCFGHIRVSSVSSPVGAITFSLPFGISAGVVNRGGGATMYYDNSANDYSIVGYRFHEGTSTIQIMAQFETPAASDEIFFEFVYWTA